MRAKPKAKVKASPKAKSITPEEKRRLAYEANRELAMRSLHHFVRQAWHAVEPEKAFMDNWHIKAVADHLQAVTEGKIENLLINIPPGTMKSLMVAVFWPCWEWTFMPSTKWMFASYDASLSMRDSVRCRNLLMSSWYQERWPLLLQDDQNQKGMFENAQGGWRMATSVGGRATGTHPTRKIFDDPHNVKKAESETERQAVIDWWDGTMASRGALGGATSVGVMQRLNAADLSAHVLGKEEKWDHLCFPMRRELDHPHQCRSSLGFVDPRKKDGELLWPEGYSLDKVEKLEGKMGIYFSAGQLQQRPAPRGGGMFKREWFTKILPAMPTDCMKFVRYWDKAGCAGGEGARTAGTLMSQRINGRFIILDIVKGRFGSTEREAIIKSVANMDRNRFGFVEIWVEQEPGSGGKESAENTVINLAGFTCKIERVTGAKEVRAEPFAAQCAVGNVELLLGNWNEDFIAEAEQFPTGKMKDQIDAAGGAFNKLAAPTGAFSSTEGIRVGQGGGFTPDTLSAYDLDLQMPQ